MPLDKHEIFLDEAEPTYQPPSKTAAEIKTNYVLCFILGVIATLLYQHWSLPDEYITGPRGGCYYVSNKGEKVYVDHRYCQKTAE